MEKVTTRGAELEAAADRLNQFRGLPANGGPPDINDRPLADTPTNVDQVKIVAAAERAVGDSLRVENEGDRKPRSGENIRLRLLNQGRPLNSVCYGARPAPSLARSAKQLSVGVGCLLRRYAARLSPARSREPHSRGASRARTLTKPEAGNSNAPTDRRSDRERSTLQRPAQEQTDRAQTTSSCAIVLENYMYPVLLVTKPFNRFQPFPAFAL